MHLKTHYLFLESFYPAALPVPLCLFHLRSFTQLLLLPPTTSAAPRSHAACWTAALAAYHYVRGQFRCTSDEFSSSTRAAASGHYSASGASSEIHSRLQLFPMFPQRKNVGSLRLSVYHLTCVNFLYATLYAVEINNSSVLISSLVNWLITIAFTLHLVFHLDQSQRIRCCVLVIIGVILPIASVRACHFIGSIGRDCADVIGTNFAHQSCPFIMRPLPASPTQLAAGTLNNVFNVLSFGAPLIALRTVKYPSPSISL
jgi:hypothetical protein